MGFCLNFSGQNLVPNPSFETYVLCPTTNSDNQIICATPWKGTNTSSDYYNSCANGQFPAVGVPFGNGDQFAKSGQACAGIYIMNSPGTDYREYLHVQLLTQLQLSRNYYVRYYVIPDNRSALASNNIECFLSNNTISTPEYSQGNMIAPFIPQIRQFSNPIVKNISNWTKIESVYKSLGNENYLTIGNFSSDLNTNTENLSAGSFNAAYYFVDDVSVEEITQPFWQYHDTTIYYGDSVLIGPALTGLDIDWYTDNLDFISNAPGIYVTPPTSRDYIAKETFNGVETEHVVHVTVIGGAGLEENELQNVRVFPNPSKGSFSISGLMSDKPLQLEVRDLHGKLVFSQTSFEVLNGISTFTLDVDNGIYFVNVINPITKESTVEKLVIYK
jgi:hypothetical protein